MIVTTTTSKKFYTRAQDEAIIKALSEKKNIAAISEIVGHSEASVGYRIQRVLKNPKYNSLDDIDYRGHVEVTSAAVVVSTPEVTIEDEVFTEEEVSVE